MDHAELPAIEYRGRAQQVRDRLDGVPALLVTDLTNIRWLTGFTGSNGWVLLRPDGIVLGTDGRYADQAAAQLEAAGVEATVRIGYSHQHLVEELVTAAAGLEAVGAEAAHVPFAEWQRLASELPLRSADGIIESLRRIKDAGEVARIERACKIADGALAAVAPMLAERPTEADVRDELEYRMRKLGADGPSYETIVASGPTHAARPHHRPTRTVIEAGHTVVIDVGALVDGYHSDMTRSFVVGDPTPEQREWYDVVLASQLAGLAAVGPGAGARDVDAACREVFRQAGLLEHYLHGTGHGVGLLIHEEPYHSRTSTDELLVGDVVTVEPGLYRGGFGGIRIEDLVTVTSDGSRILTTSPKDSPCPPSPPTT
jgi:Xaa-Pro aminopeptidase